MDLDLRQLPPRDCYKLLVSTVVPRPIALVTTINPEGRVNAAPFSFFNAIGSDPPIVVLGIGDRVPGIPKDTARNIRATHEFVVNLVDEALGRQMNICAIDFPAEMNELHAADLPCVPSVDVRPPRVGSSPVSLECREVSTVELGRNRVILGQVLRLHIRDDLLDRERLYVRTDQMHLLGRMHGGGWYTCTNDFFEIPRVTFEEWRAKHAPDNPGR
jgi:flavin reductase (DIM6/NTAB) family NADH-FMN oxidoreductase RutF